MNSKDGWKPSTYSNHEGNIGKKVEKELLWTKPILKDNMIYWVDLLNATKM